MLLPFSVRNYCECRGGHWPSVQQALRIRSSPVWKRTQYRRTSTARPYNIGVYILSYPLEFYTAKWLRNERFRCIINL